MAARRRIATLVALTTYARLLTTTLSHIPRPALNQQLHLYFLGGRAVLCAGAGTRFMLALFLTLLTNTEIGSYKERPHMTFYSSCGGSVRTVDNSSANALALANCLVPIPVQNALCERPWR